MRCIRNQVAVPAESDRIVLCQAAWDRETSGKGMVVEVEGADLMDGTPILDIKPYLPYVDCMPDARGGFADRVKGYALEVEIPEKLLLKLPNEQQGCVREILAEDPRPSYQNDPDRYMEWSMPGMRLSSG